MKFFIATLGCRANQADSAAIRERLLGHSLEEASGHGDADLVIINSCTVTHQADRELRQLVRRFHRENPAARLIVTGCYAQRSPHELAELEGVSCVIDNSNKGRIAEIVMSELENRQDGTYCAGARIYHDDIMGQRMLDLASFIETGGKTRPFIKIQDGCDARCSYCIIPAVRGRGRSAPPDMVVARIKELVAAGFKEAVLTGIHLGTYGQKLAERTTLAALIRRILDETDLPRLRIGSVEPMRFPRELIAIAAETERIARHFHLPLQSGSDRILRLMQRAYTAERYLRIIDEIRERLPDAAIGADVIAGFPGETESDHRLTLELVERSPLTYLHVFTYSRRDGTPAASLPDQVDDKAARRRSEELRRLSQQKDFAFRSRFQGRTLSVLTLAEDEGDECLSALSSNYFKVRLPKAGLKPNCLLEVQVVEVREKDLLAQPLSSQNGGARV